MKKTLVAKAATLAVEETACGKEAAWMRANKSWEALKAESDLASTEKI